MPRTPRTVPRTPRTVPPTPRCLALYKDPISRYRNLPPSAIGDTSPNGSYILATLLRIPHFVGLVLSDGKLTLMVSLSLFHCRPSREAPFFLEVLTAPSHMFLLLRLVLSMLSPTPSRLSATCATQMSLQQISPLMLT